MPRLLHKIKFSPIFIWLAFLFVVLIVYGSSLDTWFVSDDFHWLTIAKNTQLSGRIWLTNYAGENYGGSYNPLLVLIFKFFFVLFGTKYVWYHLVSLLVHTTNAFILYLLAKKVFAIIKVHNYASWAIIAAWLFMLWPVQVEAIYWLSAWPHLWGSLFYLLSLLFYFKFHQNRIASSLWLAWLFFAIALLIKEIAISLPLLVLLWEIYFYSIKHKSAKCLLNYWLLPVYFALLFLAMGMRYIATGLLFGYYGQHNLHMVFGTWVSNLASFFNDFVTVSFLRVLFFKVAYYHLESVVIITLAGLALYFYYLLNKKDWLQFVFFGSLILVLGPLLLLGLHHTTFAGDRYMYLASTCLSLWLTYLLIKVKWYFKIKTFLLVVFILFSLLVNNYKADLWQQAAQLSQQIVASYARLQTDQPQTFISVGLPDNLSGAEVFRNNLGQALQFNYPNNPPEILPLPAYVSLTPSNKNSHLLKWHRDDRGWFAESVDGSFVVTGITSIEVNDVYWELWNYNYQNYKANLIRLIPNQQMKDKLDRGEVKILTFDRGVLQIVD